MAEFILDQVESPALFIVGERDVQVLDLNQQALKKIKVEKKLEIVSGAGHLFEEPGALEEVARLSREWFKGHLEARGK